MTLEAKSCLGLYFVYIIFSASVHIFLQHNTYGLHVNTEGMVMGVWVDRDWVSVNCYEFGKLLQFEYVMQSNVNLVCSPASVRRQFSF
jgi:hypothetical protein